MNGRDTESAQSTERIKNGTLKFFLLTTRVLQNEKYRYMYASEALALKEKKKKTFQPRLSRRHQNVNPFQELQTTDTPLLVPISSMFFF